MKQTADRQNAADLPAWWVPHRNIRPDSYVLLAALLTNPPSQELLTLVRQLQWDEDISEKFHRSLVVLQQAGDHLPATDIADDYHRLFVGLGSGELVPYGSWYREKSIQSGPLAAIRKDLFRLGIARQTDSFETEDHAGALCEIMALLSLPANGVPHAEQAAFFDRHLAPWMMTFFRDLQAVDDADFYQAVGTFGCCFLETENEYLQRSGQQQFSEGGNRDD